MSSPPSSHPKSTNGARSSAMPRSSSKSNGPAAVAIDRRRFVAAAASALVAALPPRTASAQTSPAQGWPNRFVRLVVPFPPGGGTNIGTEAVVRSDPDGYTMLFQSMPLAVNRFLFPSLPFDALTDLAPVVLLCEYPNIMAVPVTSQAHSVMDFITNAKANPGKVTFASSGHGTSVHLSGELFKRMAGIEMMHVPYRGAGPALNDLLPGRVDVMFNNIGAVLPLIQSDKLRGLAVTTAKRSPAIPQLAPIAESGVPGFDVSSWYAIFAPSKTPPEIIRKMNADTVAALNDPVTKQRLEQLGVSVVASTPEELGRYVKAEIDKWGPVIKDANITIRE